MPQPLDYAPPARGRSRLLAAAAWISLWSPVLVAVAVYGEWLVSWACLGHRPRPSLDDPKGVDCSNWMYPIAALLMVGAVPAAVAALLLNLAHWRINTPPAMWGAIRLLIVVVSWAALAAVFGSDPGGVLYWWWD
jgi:hypothetical protein